ncbi:BTB/POZ and TAZ domain-containing protein 4, partial [Bienertia sinuspersici]
MCKMEDVVDNLVKEKMPPPAPPLPSYSPIAANPKKFLTKSKPKDVSSTKDQCSVNIATRDMYDRLFDGAFRADVVIHTDDGGQILAHANILGMASPVIRNLIKKSKGKDRRRSFSICGVPHDAVRVFIRFLYSS